MRTVHNPPRRLPNVDFGKISQDARKFDAMARRRKGAKESGWGNWEMAAIIVPFWSAGVPARGAALALGGALTLALSRKGLTGVGFKFRRFTDAGI